MIEEVSKTAHRRILIDLGRIRELAASSFGAEVANDLGQPVDTGSLVEVTAQSNKVSSTPAIFAKSASVLRASSHGSRLTASKAPTA